MAQEIQAKILRVLQERTVYRLGAREPRPARVRVLAATNRDLDEMMRRGEFRTDLYHRIADWVVELPPLRRRKGDVPNLAAFFLAREGSRLGIAPRGISKAALEALVGYGWPGNVRQLEREIARATLFLEDGDLLDTTRLSPAVAGVREAASASLKEILERTEREEIERALAQSGGDTQAASTRLGIGRSTLYRRMKELGVG
jgi:transcriptional regulator with PAS, ATPase and Fis domain